MTAYIYNQFTLKSLVLFLTFLCTTMGSATESPGADNESQVGKALYIQKGCYSCHGYEGQGGLLSGPKIAPGPLPYPAFAEIVRRPQGTMPAYSPLILKEDELTKIYKFLQQIPPPSPVSVFN